VRHDVGLQSWHIDRQKMLDGAASSRSLLTLKGFKAKKIEMEFTSAYRDEALQISAVKNWRNVSCRGEWSSEMVRDREGPSILI
jgi:hypothetical protein